MRAQHFTLADGLTAQTSLTGHCDGPYANMVLAHHGHACDAAFAAAVAAVVQSLATDREYGPLRVDLADGQQRFTGSASGADETGFSISGRRIQYDEVESLAL